MLESRESKSLQETFSKSGKKPRFNGANRRATGILPEPSGEHGHEMYFDHNTSYQQLLGQIKANQQTCCIKFSSDKYKSRGAILIFQGRILGVLYGRKDLKGKLFHEEGYSYAIKDLSDPETELVGHVLSEPLAIATASLFIGQFGITGEHAVGRDAFCESYANLTESKMPGCILVHDNEDSIVLAAYIFVGKMVALYSGTEGWLLPTTEEALQKISHRSDVKVTCTLLKVENIKEVAELTFAPSEVDDQREPGRAGFQEQSEQAFSPRKRSAGEPIKRYATTSGRSRGLCIEQELLARQRLAQLVLG